MAETAPAEKDGKAPDAYRTISEVSAILDVPQHVLRFWESKFPQIKPLKRQGGRRYYRPADLEVLSRIRDLLYTEGYTIRGARRALKQGTVSLEPEAAQKDETARQEAVASGAPLLDTPPAKTPAPAPSTASAAPQESSESPDNTPAPGNQAAQAALQSLRQDLQTLRDTLREAAAGT